MTEAGLCCVCHRELRHEDEWDRVACRPCQSRVDRDLSEIPGLYAHLSDVLAPGSGADDSPRVSTSRVHAPLPVRLEPLNLLAKGGVVTILQSWLMDWHHLLGWSPVRPKGSMTQQCDHVVKRLRANLDWAASRHPAFAEFAREVATVTRACDTQIHGDRREKTVSVRCSTEDCGHSLRVTVSTPGTRCSSCGQQYDRRSVLSLPLVRV